MKSSEESKIPYIPFILDNFEIIGELGGGLYSRTYHARGKRDNKEYAIKIFDIGIISREKEGIPKLRNMLENNRMIKQLLESKIGIEECKNIKKVYYVGSPEEPYVVTEFVRYNLREYVELRGITHREILKLLLDTARALLFIFNNSEFYCHGDICPDNIYITEEKDEITVKLGDFDGAIRPGVSVYHAMHHDEFRPLDSPDKDRKFDTYSFGLTLAELIIGEAGRRRIREDIESIEEYDISPQIKELIKKSVTSRKNRLTLDEFVKELESAYKQLIGIRPLPPPPLKEVRDVAERYLRILEDLKKNPDKDKIKKLKENVDPRFDRLMKLWEDEEKRKSPEIREIIESLKRELA